VDVGDGDEVVALLLVLLSQEVGGLVEVGGQRAVLQRGVGRLVVVDLLDVQLDAGALGEVVLDPLEDLDVGLGRGAAAVARPPAMTVRREMKEDMVVPFAGPGGPQ